LGFLEDVCGKGKSFDLLLLYNQDWKLGRSLAALCRRHSIAFVQSFTERHAPGDYKLGVLEPHFLREYIHFLLIPRHCDGAVVISTGLKIMLPKHLYEKTLVVPAMTNTESGGGSIERKREKDVFQVAYFGGGIRRETPDLLLDAAAILVGSFPQLRVVLFGLIPEALSHLTGHVSREHLEKTVSLRGRVTEEELRELFGATDAFVLPRCSDFSAKCSFPTRLPELLLAGAPVIVSDVGDVGNYLEDAKSAMFLRSGTGEELAEKIAFLIANPEVKESIGSCGRSAVDKCFSYRKWGDEVLSFFRTRILGGAMENRH
jgi:glycosyltransferase involved in cell wall biosynthesis